VTTTKTTTNTYEGQGIERLEDFSRMLVSAARCLDAARMHDLAHIDGNLAEAQETERAFATLRDSILRKRPLFDLMFPPGSEVRLELGF